jgi:uncharacterized membrane protein (Fun14 family)
MTSCPAIHVYDIQGRQQDVQAIGTFVAVVIGVVFVVTQIAVSQGVVSIDWHALEREVKALVSKDDLTSFMETMAQVRSPFRTPCMCTF